MACGKTLTLPTEREGTVTDIILDAEEKYDRNLDEVTTAKLPCYLLVKLDWTHSKPLEGLQELVIRVEPVTQSLQIQLCSRQRWENDPTMCETASASSDSSITHSPTTVPKAKQYLVSSLIWQPRPRAALVYSTFMWRYLVVQAGRR